MARRKDFVLLLAVVAIAIVSCFVAVCPIAAASAESGSVGGENSEPIFYGATKITLTKDAITAFSVKDARFRIFARDRHGRDLTPYIVCESDDVDPTVAGEYSVRYVVTDGRENSARITVPVTVLDETGEKFVIERTVYAVPAMKNMSFIGTERCNTGDRQILGIYLPEGSSFLARTVSADAESDFQITFFTNTRAKNSFGSISKTPGEYRTLSNVKSGVSYSSVPLITSPRLSEEITDKTYKIEVSFDGSAKPLDYYHYKDDEQAFVSEWKSTESDFGVVDGEAMLVVVPFADADKLSNYRSGGYNAPFASLDAFFEYYLEVVNRMDEWIGLSFDAANALDRNYRIKYTCAADGGMSGVGAYYAGGFIAVGSYTAAPFFQYGWGTLHEIAHGYQGYLGRGNTNGMNIGLNETGNNVLAYYVQNDRTLYLGTDNWMGGSLAAVEKARNSLRLSGGEVFVATSTYANASEKLYALINLFNSFEGAKTYGKLFSYYRALAAEKGVNAFTTPDLYALFFAEEYGANVIPYLKAWKLAVSDEADVEVSSKDLVPFVIPSDVLGEEQAKELKEDGSIELLFAPVAESVLNASEETDLTININVDDFDVIKGRYAGIYKGSELIKLVLLSDEQVTVKGLKIGFYRILMPPLIDYDVKNPSFILTAERNELTIDYVNSALSKKIFHPTKLRLLGIYGTEGFSMTFSNDNKTATVALGGADMGNRNSTWAAKPDEVYASVTVVKQDGEVANEYAIKGNEYFSSLPLGNPQITLEYGYKIRVYTQKPEKVGVWSLLTNPSEEITAYRTADQTTEYEVTEDGLKKPGEEEFFPAKILYETIKDEWIKKIADYSETLTDEQAKNLRFNTKAKREILRIYDNLNEEERVPFSDFCQKIGKGNPPVVTLLTERTEIYVGEEIDLLALISVSDVEDLYIDVTSNSVSVNTTLDNCKQGIYSVTYTVVDSDGNASSATLEVEVKAKINPPSPGEGDPDKPNGPGENEPKNDNPDNETDNGKLGKTAIIGIVCAAVFALIFAVSAIIFVRKKNRKKS